MYSDISLHTSQELADKFIEASGSLNNLRQMHEDFFQNTWSSESIDLLMDISPVALRYVVKFRFYDEISSSIPWVNKLLRIAASLSDEKVAEAEKIQTLFRSRETEYWSKYNLFLRNAPSENSELHIAAALMLMRYDYKILESADSILCQQLDPSDRSLEKLIAVCDFVERRENIEMPVHWMLEF